MPLHGYRRKQCGHVTTFLEKSRTRKPHPCKKCGSAEAEKLLSAFAVRGGEASSSGSASCPTGTCPLGRPKVEPIPIVAAA